MAEIWADEVADNIKRNYDPKIWCMSCKAQYGQYKDKNTGQKIWHLKAQRMAYWVITSLRHSKGAQRAYCLECINELENIDKDFYAIQDQCRDGLLIGDTKFWKLSTRLPTGVDNEA